MDFLTESLKEREKLREKCMLRRTKCVKWKSILLV